MLRALKNNSLKRICNRSHIEFLSACKIYQLIPKFIHLTTKRQTSAALKGLPQGKRVWLIQEIRNKFAIQEQLDREGFRLWQACSLQFAFAPAP